MSYRVPIAPRTNVDPAQGAVVITKSDTNDIWGVAYSSTQSVACRALYVGGTGDLKVRMANGDDVLFSSVPVGIFPIAITRLYSTLTSATLVVALK